MFNLPAAVHPQTQSKNSIGSDLLAMEAPKATMTTNPRDRKGCG